MTINTVYFTLSYDEVYNRKHIVESSVTTNYQVSNLNQYSSVGSTALTYDDSGNITEGILGLEYQYDCSNRLTTVTVDNGSLKIVNYKYDYANRRVSKKNNSNFTTRYCYSGDRIIAEDRYDGTLLRKFVYG